MVVYKKKLIFLKWGLFIACVLLVSVSVWGERSVGVKYETMEAIEVIEAIEDGDELIYCPEAGGICFVGDMGYGGISMPPKD